MRHTQEKRGEYEKILSISSPSFTSSFFLLKCQSQCNEMCIPVRRQTVETATPFRRLMAMTDRSGVQGGSRFASLLHS
ncbi:Uncharacterized protein APZ42_030498 [Daphnia magna]|uniref:Uncharacterized protein n=1 Tax=Daphnia magna TaxID=35525 RepID=A0A164NJA5_9CRUS|nr:Uncharacterized protein APZ42_030498 [Daphnia magna]